MKMSGLPADFDPLSPSLDHLSIIDEASKGRSQPQVTFFFSYVVSLRVKCGCCSCRSSLVAALVVAAALDTVLVAAVVAAALMSQFSCRSPSLFLSQF